MTTAIVFFSIERTKVPATGEILAGIPGVSEVYSVSGRYDLVAIIRVSDNDKLAELITEKISRVEGITHTETMVAFRTYSRYDIATLFEIGD